MSFLRIKILYAFVCVLVFASGAFSADDDVYVRKDVFEAKFDRIFDEFAKIHKELDEFKTLVRKDIDELKAGQQSIREEQQAIRDDIAKQSSRIDVLSARLDETNRLIDYRFDNVNNRFDDETRRLDFMSNIVYLFFVFLGAVLGLPYIQKFLDWKANRQPQITIEEVKRLIEESKRQQ